MLKSVLFRVSLNCLVFTLANADFNCRGKSVGYYAETLDDCRTFYVCDDHGLRSSFHCGPGTTFNQKARVCDWPNNSNCQSAPDWYFLNDFTYGARVPSSARPHQRTRRKRKRRNKKPHHHHYKHPHHEKEKKQKVVYFPAFYNLNTAFHNAGGYEQGTGGGRVVWRHGGSNYYWDPHSVQPEDKIVWDHPIGEDQSSLVDKVIWDPQVTKSDHSSYTQVTGDDFDFQKKSDKAPNQLSGKNPRRMMLYYKTR